jgi:hypothetical protein
MSALPMSTENTSRLTKHRVDIGIVSAFVLVVREDAEYLREVLHVNAPPSRRAIETLYGEGFAFDASGVPREAPNLVDRNQFDGRNNDPDGAGQFQHDVFVFGNRGKLSGWQFDDP